MLEAAAFVVLSILFTGYVLLDGYDLGIAAAAPFVARDDRERGALIRAIGPFWNGNEVWLIAAGAGLFALFPRAYAVAFSGFYLPLIVVLWLLMFRGMAIELRGTIDSSVWRQLWDGFFTLSSALLAVVLGIALGNLIRGVDVGGGGWFMGTFSVLLNPFALGAGLLALAALAMHGLLYGAMRIEGALGERCAHAARTLWPWLTIVAVVMTAAAFAIYRRADLHPVLSGVLTVAALASLAWLRRSIARPRAGYAASCVFLALLMVAAAATLYPYLIPHYPRGTGGVSIYDAGAAPPGQLLALLSVMIAAIVALLLYRRVASGRLTRPVRVDDAEGYG